MNTEKVSSEELAKYDFAVLIDKSGSMSTTDCPGGKSRWDYAKEQTEAIAREAAKYDSDGIDVVVFAGQPKAYNGVTPDKVTGVFNENSPSGSTNTAAALELVLKGYRDRKAAGSAKPLIVVCITDGVPDSEADVERVIIEHTKTMTDDNETGIQFAQVGKDEHARAFLKRLDDGLEAKGAKFDIVDTKNGDEMETISILELLTSAVTD